MLERIKFPFAIDLRSLALFRIALGLLILTDLVLRATDLQSFYTDNGVLARRFALDITHRWHWSLHTASGEWWWQVCLFILAAVFALGLILGYRSRSMAFASFILLASLLNRNGLVLQGGDQLLVIMCFWSMFLPLGVRYSVDAALNTGLAEDKQKQAGTDALHPPYKSHESLKLHESHESLKLPGRIDSQSSYLSVATVAITLQILYLYIFTAIMKTGDAWTSSFDAAFYALSLQHFVTPIGEWFRQFPAFLRLATRYVLSVELIAPALVLCPIFWPWLRIAGLLFLLSLHIAFALMLHIGLFPLIDMMALSILIPTSFWLWLERWSANKRSNKTLYYTAGNELHRKLALIVREFLPLRYARIQAREPGNDQAVQGKPLVSKLLTLNGRSGNFLNRLLAYRRMRVTATIPGSLLAALFLYVVTAFNIYDLPKFRGSMPVHVDYLARTARIDQRWDMFAPYPLMTSMYPMIPAKLRNGDSVNLYPLTSNDADWPVPDRFYPLFSSYRWRKFLGRVDVHHNNTVRQAFGDHMCRSWNTTDRPRAQQLATLQIRFVKFTSNMNNEPKQRQERMVWRHWCFAEFAPTDS